VPTRKTSPVTPTMPSEAPLVECIVSYVGAAGSFAAGAVLRADHPAVTQNSTFWVRAHDPGAKAAALMAIQADIDASAAASARNRDDAYRPQPGIARATRPLTVVVDGSDGAPRSRSVSKGDLLDATDPLVSAHSDYFEVS
jgi:hypothetical protein